MSLQFNQCPDVPPRCSWSPAWCRRSISCLCVAPTANHQHVCSSQLPCLTLPRKAKMTMMTKTTTPCTLAPAFSFNTASVYLVLLSPQLLLRLQRHRRPRAQSSRSHHVAAGQGFHQRQSNRRALFTSASSSCSFFLPQTCAFHAVSSAFLTLLRPGRILRRV